MTNVRDVVIAPGQRAVFSRSLRTARWTDGVYSQRSPPGAFRFGDFIVKDHATVTLQSSSRAIALATLELHYGAVLVGGHLVVVSNEVRVHHGAKVELSGGGHRPGEGTGAGAIVRSDPAPVTLS